MFLLLLTDILHVGTEPVSTNLEFIFILLYLNGELAVNWLGTWMQHGVCLIEHSDLLLLLKMNLMFWIFYI